MTSFGAQNQTWGAESLESILSDNDDDLQKNGMPSSEERVSMETAQPMRA